MDYPEEVECVARIEATDGAFKTSRCGAWKPFPAMPIIIDTITDGMWIVGDEIVPGTYTMFTDGDFCSWSRLSGFGDGDNDDIASSYESGRAFVAIEPTDKGFQTENCGPWTRVE